jgi:hypothetical protein
MEDEALRVTTCAERQRWCRTPRCKDEDLETFRNRPGSIIYRPTTGLSYNLNVFTLVPYGRCKYCKLTFVSCASVCGTPAEEEC